MNLLLNMIKDCAINYFKSFQDKDLNRLRDFFSPHITLRDWNVEVQGIENVMLVYSEIFRALNKIEVDITNIYTNRKTVIGELILSIDNNFKLRVVDIIEFSSLSKIESIRAYKG